MPTFMHGWVHLSTGGGDNAHLTIFSFVKRATLHIAKLATNFNNLNVIKKGRPLSELNLEHLQKAVEIPENTGDYFRRKIICVQKDNTLATIAQRPNVSSVISTQAKKPLSNAPAQRSASSAPKRPFQQPLNAEAPSPPQRRRLHSAPQWDPKDKGLFYLKDPTDLHPFPSNVTVCSGFTCHERNAPTPGAGMTGDTYSNPRIQLLMYIIEAAGGHFLTTGTG